MLLWLSSNLPASCSPRLGPALSSQICALAGQHQGKVTVPEAGASPPACPEASTTYPAQCALHLFTQLPAHISQPAGSLCACSANCCICSTRSAPQHAASSEVGVERRNCLGAHVPESTMCSEKQCPPLFTAVAPLPYCLLPARPGSGLGSPVPRSSCPAVPSNFHDPPHGSSDALLTPSPVPGLSCLAPAWLS